MKLGLQVLRWCLLLSTASGAFGCGVTVSYTPSMPLPGRAPVAPSQLRNYIDNTPRCRFETTGIYDVGAPYGFNATITESVEALANDAARRGLDGFYDLQCAPAGSVGSNKGRCNAKGYVCER